MPAKVGSSEIWYSSAADALRLSDADSVPATATTRLYVALLARLSTMLVGAVWSRMMLSEALLVLPARSRKQTHTTWVPSPTGIVHTLPVEYDSYWAVAQLIEPLFSA